MDFDGGGHRMRRCDIDCTKQEILKIECEKSNNATS